MKRSNAENPTLGLVKMIDATIERAVRARASDVHFDPAELGVRVRYRIDGRLHDVEMLPLSLLPNIVTRLKVMAGLLSYRVDIPQEGGLTIPNPLGSENSTNGSLDVRIATIPTIRGERVAVRLLPATGEARSLDALGLGKATATHLLSAASDQQGLILTTGPAGSGKTTTLYALLSRLKELMPGANLMTVEDPVERRLDGVAQIQIAPHGELCYARALRSLLRQDPQIILVGEIRDAETAQIATEAALTGHLILSSMHCGTAVGGIVRLLEMGIPPYQVTSTLRLIVCQRLLRTLCRQCGQGRERTTNAAAAAVCETCFGTGFCGRTACAESVPLSKELRAAILASSDARSLAEIVRNQPGYTSLSQDAARHVREGTTTHEEVQAWLSGGNGAI